MQFLTKKVVGFPHGYCPDFVACQVVGSQVRAVEVEISVELTVLGVGCRRGIEESVEVRCRGRVNGQGRSRLKSNSRRVRIQMRSQ